MSGKKTTQREIKTDCSFNYVKWMGTQTMPTVVGNLCFLSQKSEKLDRSNKRENTAELSWVITRTLPSTDTGLYCTKFITKLSPRCFSSRKATDTIEGKLRVQFIISIGRVSTKNFSHFLWNPPFVLLFLAPLSIYCPALWFSETGCSHFLNWIQRICRIERDW